MKKLQLNKSSEVNNSWLKEQLKTCTDSNKFVSTTIKRMSTMNIEFYQYIGELLSIAGLHANITREGDVNCRFDATIIDKIDSIPIEIKSPGEDAQINIKAIRQALENKIVLLSRKFYPTSEETSSMAIAQFYPNDRSDVYELIDDIYKVWNIRIGLINLEDLIRLAYAVNNQKYSIDMEYFNHLKGKFNYEKAIIKHKSIKL